VDALIAHPANLKGERFSRRKPPIQAMAAKAARVLVEVADSQIPAPQQGFEISELKNPRPHAAARGIILFLL